MERLNDIFPSDILEKYEIYSYYHAAEILSLAYPEEFQDLIDALRNVHITIEDILQAGGNESPIPPKFKSVLFPKGWAETRVHGDLTTFSNEATKLMLFKGSSITKDDVISLVSNVLEDDVFPSISRRGGYRFLCIPGRRQARLQ